MSLDLTDKYCVLFEKDGLAKRSFTVLEDDGEYLLVEEFWGLGTIQSIISKQALSSNPIRQMLVVFEDEDDQGAFERRLR